MTATNEIILSQITVSHNMLYLCLTAAAVLLSYFIAFCLKLLSLLGEVNGSIIKLKIELDEVTSRVARIETDVDTISKNLEAIQSVKEVIVPMIEVNKNMNTFAQQLLKTADQIKAKIDDEVPKISGALAKLK